MAPTFMETSSMYAHARLGARLLAAALALTLLTSPAFSQSPAATVNPWKLAYAKRLAEEGMERHRSPAELKRELRERERALRAALRERKAAGERARKAPVELGLPTAEPAGPTRAARGFGAHAFTTPGNSLVNNPAGEGADVTQSETSIIAVGDRMVAAWNDAAGFPADTEGWGTSIDGGLTWTDRGTFPHAPGRNSFEWVSDPVLAVNEKSGAVFFTALCEFFGGSGNATLFSGVAIIKGRWNGNTFTWGAPVVTDSVSADLFLSLDKQWVVADSSTGRVYLTYSHFSNNGDSRIMFQSSDSSATQWSPSRQLSLNIPTENSWVQGSRPAVDGDGRLYVMYYLIGQGFADYYRVLTSTDGGVTFNTPVTAESLYTNFGSGAPGFNRAFGVQFPGISVDRSHGPHRGRLYLSFTESINWLDDTSTLGQVDSRSEVEPNNTLANARPAIVGSTLRGQLSSASDVDIWTLPLTAGEHVIVEGDSVGANAVVTLRLYDRNGTTALTYTNFDVTFNPLGFWMFTAPAAGTYYLRVGAEQGSGSGGYRVRTGNAVRGPERGRDQRDVFVAWSDNGSSWSEPSRLSGDAGGPDPVGFDAFLPEVTVAPDGGVYAAWYDFHDAVATDGGASSIALARSGDGGDTWTTLGAVSDTASNWSSSLSFLTPNLGDYISMFTNTSSVWVCWSDARRGNPDVFSAQLPIIPNGAQVAFRNVQLANQKIAMSWLTTPPDTLAMRLYRSQDDGAYQNIAAVTFDAAGELAYTDTLVTGNHVYAYRLGKFTNGIELFYGQVRVFLPSTFGLSMSAPRPNPVTGNSFVAAFSLATNEPADLILFDISGREVLRQRINPGAGPHTFTVPVGHGLKQGLYVLTLRQGGHNASTRAYLVR
jgi:hypothetical protein